MLGVPIGLEAKMDYETDPTKRCMTCNARLVIEDKNLVELFGGLFKCRDTNECKRNVNAENTNVSIYYNEENEIDRVAAQSNTASIEVFKK